MARIRTIKPEFWTDEKTGTLTEFSKCLFLGLLNHADDYGVLEWSPAEWRAKIFPYHSDTTTGGVNGALVGEILPKMLAVIFALNDDSDGTKQYLFLKNFERHQVINKRSKPLLPNWQIGDNPKTYANRLGHEFKENDGSGTVVLREDYFLERKGKEESIHTDTTTSESKTKIRTDTKNSSNSSAVASHLTRFPANEFDTAFWPTYPHKIGKAAARTAFEKARRRTALATIMEGLSLYRAKTDDRPWCNPATWLNQDRWLDEPAAFNGHRVPIANNRNVYADRDSVHREIERRAAERERLEELELDSDSEANQRLPKGLPAGPKSPS